MIGFKNISSSTGLCLTVSIRAEIKEHSSSLQLININCSATFLPTRVRTKHFKERIKFESFVSLFLSFARKSPATDGRAIYRE